MSLKPSPYELTAWADLTRPRALRPVSRAAAAVNDQVGGVAGRARDAVQGNGRASGALEKVRSTGATLRGKVPRGISAVAVKGADAGRRAAEGGARAVARVATAFLSPKRIVKAHARAGHNVSKLADLRDLDLELIDKVKPRSLDVAYAAAAALSGGVAGAVITGSQIAVPVSGGVAAAPSGTAIASAFAADAAAVMGLASAVVAHHALHYGYDPARPEEKVFVLSVVNWGTAVTAGSKATAFADVSRLTQALVRGASWRTLNESMVAVVAGRFAAAFGNRLIKQGLGKVVPVASIVAGSSLNWLTLEQIADAADVAYRRRFLLAKYPQLESEAPEPVLREFEIEAVDETIAVVDLMRDAGADLDDFPHGKFPDEDLSYGNVPPR